MGGRTPFLYKRADFYFLENMIQGPAQVNSLAPGFFIAISKKRLKTAEEQRIRGSRFFKHFKLTMPLQGIIIFLREETFRIRNVSIENKRDRRKEE